MFLKTTPLPADLSAAAHTSALEEAIASVRDHPNAAFHGLRAQEGGGAKGLSAALPHPVYVLGARDIAEGSDDLGRLRPVSWRYLILDERERPVAAADLDPASAAVMSIHVGPFVEATEEAVALAEANTTVGGSESFEVRLLTVPALYLVALWLEPEGSSRDGGFVVPLRPLPPGVQRLGIAACEPMAIAPFLSLLAPLASRAVTGGALPPRSRGG